VLAVKTILSVRQNLWTASLAFVVVLLVGYGADLFLFRHPAWMLIDDLILALAAGVLVFQYERERTRFLSEKLRVIREMNAFVRNELQILNASVEHLDRPRVSTIESSVARIDWALRELLPGKEMLAKATSLTTTNQHFKHSA
jgi:hypothetical protein